MESILLTPNLGVPLSDSQQQCLTLTFTVSGDSYRWHPNIPFVLIGLGLVEVRAGPADVPFVAVKKANND